MYPLLTGELLFSTHNNAEHLALMENLLGPMPTHMGSRCSEFFDATGRLRWPELARRSHHGERNKKTNSAAFRLDARPNSPRPTSAPSPQRRGYQPELRYVGHDILQA